jgi:serine O-acetyltransferase
VTKIMKLYRLSNKAYEAKIPFVPKILSRIIRLIFSAEIPYSCKLDHGVDLIHGGLGVVIHPKVYIGKNTKIYQNVTIGGREGRGHPYVGNNVYIGTGACILGGITIGDNSKIGANAVVLSDVPKGAVVVGIPAKVIKIE